MELSENNLEMVLANLKSITMEMMDKGYSWEPLCSGWRWRYRKEGCGDCGREKGHFHGCKSAPVGTVFQSDDYMGEA